MSAVDVHVLDTPACILGEGPFWDADRSRLSWVDIDASRLFWRGPSGAVDAMQVSAGALSAAFPADDGWLLVMDHGFGFQSRSQGLVTLAQPETEMGARLRMNDAACDPSGRLWAGSMSISGSEPIGSLLRMDLDGSVSRVVTGLTVANGMGWSPDGRSFYLVDSIPGVLWSWRFEPDEGTLTERYLVSDDLGPGIPDGLTVDADGCLWIAFFGGGLIRRFSPSGALAAEFPLPLLFPTSVCFGDAGLDTLYVTSAQGPEPEPHAGQLLALDPGVSGLPAHSFGGCAIPPSASRTKAGQP